MILKDCDISLSYKKLSMMRYEAQSHSMGSRTNIKILSQIFSIEIYISYVIQIV